MNERAFWVVLNYGVDPDGGHAGGEHEDGTLAMHGPYSPDSARALLDYVRGFGLNAWLGYQRGDSPRINSATLAAAEDMRTAA